MESVALAVIGLLVLASAPLIPLFWRLAAALVLSVPQLYLIPVGGVYFSLSMLLAYMLWPEGLKYIGVITKLPALNVVLLLCAFQVISWAWSPDLRLGFRALVYSLPLLLVAMATYCVAKFQPRLVMIVLGIVCASMLFEVALVVWFRFDLDLEESYFTWDYARLLSGSIPEEITYGIVRTNASDPEKAGGWFFNANVASLYLGMGAVIAFFIAKLFQSLTLRSVAAIIWCGVFFTGSKAGMLFACALPILGVCTVKIFKLRHSMQVVVLAFVVAIVSMVVWSMQGMIASLWSTSEYLVQSADTTASRVLIWGYFFQEYLNSPFLGQGFGGWEAGIQNYALSFGVPEGMPPHNTFISLWSQSGIVAVILAALFMVRVFTLSFDLIKSACAEHQTLGASLLVCSAWLFLHGMGENMGLLGDPRQQPLLAAMIGLAYAVKARRDYFNSQRVLHQSL